MNTCSCHELCNKGNAGERIIVSRPETIYLTLPRDRRRRIEHGTLPYHMVSSVVFIVHIFMLLCLMYIHVLLD